MKFTDPVKHTSNQFCDYGNKVEMESNDLMNIQVVYLFDIYNIKYFYIVARLI